MIMLKTHGKLQMKHANNYNTYESMLCDVHLVLHFVVVLFLNNVKCLRIYYKIRSDLLYYKNVFWGDILFGAFLLGAGMEYNNNTLILFRLINSFLFLFEYTQRTLVT